MGTHLGHNVTAKEQATSHEFPGSRIALHHLIPRLEALVRDLGHAQLLMEGSITRTAHHTGDCNTL